MKGKVYVFVADSRVSAVMTDKGKEIENIQVIDWDACEQGVCPVCGKELDWEDVVCPNCGIDTDKADYEEAIKIANDLENSDE